MNKTRQTKAHLEYLAFYPQMSVSIPPLYPRLQFSKPSFVDICPSELKESYHPYIIEALKLMYGKAPDEINTEEWDQFWPYYNWKKEKGEPIESEVSPQSYLRGFPQSSP